MSKDKQIKKSTDRKKLIKFLSVLIIIIAITISITGCVVNEIGVANNSAEPVVLVGEPMVVKVDDENVEAESNEAVASEPEVADKPVEVEQPEATVTPEPTVETESSTVSPEPVETNNTTNTYNHRDDDGDGYNHRDDRNRDDDRNHDGHRDGGRDNDDYRNSTASEPAVVTEVIPEPTVTPEPEVTQPSTETTEPSEIVAEPTPTTNEETSTSGAGLLTLDTTQYSYTDGTYVVQTVGYNPSGMQLSVTIKNNRIESIDILQQNETPEYYYKVANTIPAAIMANQSTAVDNISGSTMSTQAIIKGVKAALEQAKVAK